MAGETIEDAGKDAGTVPSASPASTKKPGAKALGRGLEDVSHLFLTRRQAEAAPGPRADAPAGGTATVLLRSWHGTPSRDQLRALLNTCGDALGEPLTPVHPGLPCERAGEIDLLAVDTAGRLVIIDVDPADSDGLLLRGLTHVSWLTRNLALLRSSYDGPRVDFSAPPRLFLLAQRFPPGFLDAVQGACQFDVLCIRYHALDLGGRLGIYFERSDAEARDGSSLPEIVFT